MMKEETITYKHIPPVMVAITGARVEDRAGILPVVEDLRKACGDAVCGPAIVILHGGALKTGILIEAAFPVNRSVQALNVQTRTLERMNALCTLHRGSHQNIRESVVRVYEHLSKHAWTGTGIRREVYHVLNPSDVEQQVTEIQVPMHEWEHLLAEGVEQELGTQAREILMQGSEAITAETSFEDYAAWVQGAIQRLDDLTGDPALKCRTVSRCAHVFPQERIDFLRSLYLQRGSVDAVLQEMYRDEFWYENPVRRGNVIHMRKNPYNPEGYASAATPAERRKAYCHCPFVHPYLDEIPSKLSPTFCYCGAGWYRRLWEGILGQPVEIEHVETLLRGNDQCTMRITLPLELEGEMSPEQVTR